MKKKLILLLGVMCVLATIGAIIIKLATPKADLEAIKAEDKLQVVTTFYPVYMIGLNIADQLEDIEVKSLTELNTGCLHDYQLTTEDMKIISKADVMIINGGGMEGFLSDVIENYPQLTIIDASQGITMLSNGSDENHEEDEAEVLKDEVTEDSENVTDEDSDHDHGENNPHVWLDPTLYVKQIENVRDGLIKYLSDINTDFSSLSKGINENAQIYIQTVQKLDEEIEDSMKSLAFTSNQEVSENQVVIFHDSFEYFANRIGMKVAFTVPLDSDTALSAGDIAEIINTVRAENIKYLFTEQQYSDSIAKQIAAETEAKVYIIDSVVTGDGSKDSYLKAMQNNINVLKEALQ